MFDYIKGKLVYKKPEKVIIDINGLGFRVNIPVSTYEKLPDLKEQVALWTYLHVKEDSLELFGFSSEDELNLFLNLLTISKIGPKTALNVLSFISIEQFKEALDNKDVSKLTKVSGIGKKTAQRIILELSGKLIFEGEGEGKAEGRQSTVIENALSGLTNLGMSRSEAMKAIKNSGIEINKDTKVQDLIKACLKSMRSD